MKNLINAQKLKIAKRKKSQLLTKIQNNVKDLKLKAGDIEQIEWEENGRSTLISIECFNVGRDGGELSFDMKLNKKQIDNSRQNQKGKIAIFGTVDLDMFCCLTSDIEITFC